ncbi:MAG TPA: Asp-tRNA(Asn)/Glu-tRNA(Gln) amidotransferase subunit GatA [Candidatus Paceibacterota bacterium]|nr:Asp-tRNA(Asn)/Glu-tRNA(Gln) amidotransferase subunit GatA [Candidatus Paceibacterota bacterium]
MNLNELTIKKAHEAMKRGDYTAVALAETYLTEIEKKNPELNAYLEVFADVLEQAKVADERFKSGEATLLTGIPFAIKDNILIKGRIVSSASKLLENYTATYDATVIEKLKKEGVVFLGRTNMDEFAMGGSTENSAYGVTRNPHDPTRVPGGSSGGSATAVGANLCLVALGSDTGGSIRQPSAFCGAVGLKPTYGSVSRYGVMAMASSLDQIGPIAKNVEDAEVVYDAIRGWDRYDSTSYDLPVVPEGERKDGKKIRIGIPESFLNQGGIDEVVITNFRETLKKLEQAGCEIKTVEMPNLHYSLATYYITVFSEVSANMARFDGVRYGEHLEGKDLLEDYMKTRGEKLGREVRRRIMLGTYVLSAGYYDAYYNKATQVRELIRRDYAKAFDEVDVVATPVAPSPAYPIGKNTNDPLKMYLEDIFTVPINMAGVPGMAVPTGFTPPVAGQAEAGLPLSIQIVAPWRRDDILFTLGKIIEKCQV